MVSTQRGAFARGWHGYGMSLALVVGCGLACGPSSPGPQPRSDVQVDVTRDATSVAEAAAPSPAAPPAPRPDEPALPKGAVPQVPAPEPMPVGPKGPPVPLSKDQREVLQRALAPLQEAAEARARHDSLPKSRWVGEDQSSNAEKIDALLDDVLEALELGEASGTRQALRLIDQRRRALDDELVRAREARLIAPPTDEQGRVERYLSRSREEWDARVRELEGQIADSRVEAERLQAKFSEELVGIGLELSPEAVRSLLGTVSGDGFLKLVVVFDNVRNITVQLQDLTEQSGESLDAARRYYGSYVVLLELLDRLQKEFVRDVRERHQVALDDFERRAALNIEEAYRNEKRGGDALVARQNVDSNQLTLHATRLYREYLEQQARAVEAQNALLAVRLRDARNTLATVQLSSSVAQLLSEGRRQVEALVRLEVPALRGFENRELEREFARLTQELGRLD